jgi:hypothetical protein
MPDTLLVVALTVYLLATPLSAHAVYTFGGHREFWALANSYTVGVAHCVIYFYPLLLPRATSAVGFEARLHRATMHWATFLSTFTALTAQLCHNLFQRQLSGSDALAWPFFCYALSDSRWNSYPLTDSVTLINANGAALGLLVGLALAWQRWSTGSCWARPSVASALVIVFRDATLFRGTIEYMLDHHRSGYALTVTDPALRPHAIAILWLINVTCCVAPPLTLVWAHVQLRRTPRSTLAKSA